MGSHLEPLARILLCQRHLPKWAASELPGTSSGTAVVLMATHVGLRLFSYSHTALIEWSEILQTSIGLRNEHYQEYDASLEVYEDRVKLTSDVVSIAVRDGSGGRHVVFRMPSEEWAHQWRDIMGQAVGF